MSDETNPTAASKARDEQEETEPVVKVTDKRRFLDPDAVVDAEPMTDPVEDVLKVERLRLQLEEKDAHLRVLRAQVVDFEKKMQDELRETRARLERTFTQRVAGARNEIFRELLSVFDNLDLVVSAAAQGTKEDLLSGVTGTQRLLVHALQQQGVERIEATGQPFDPDQHEAVDTVEVEPEKDGLVVSQMRPGYRVGGQLLRPAMVRVGRAVAGVAEAANGDGAGDAEPA
jgi:molecular chaperone GrpE